MSKAKNADKKEETKEQPKKETSKKAKTQLQEKKTEEIQAAVAQEMKENKKIPKTELGKINLRIFQNICIAIVIMLYLDLIALGFNNIDNNIFVTDIKVFSVIILIISIGILEHAYKKDSGKYAAYGVEVLMLAFVTIALVYVNLMYSNKFVEIVALIAMVYAIYYVAKSIVIYNKMKKQYFIDAMKEIIKK